MFELILRMLEKVGESILSKVVEQTADNALKDAKNVKDFEPNLKALQKKLKLLNAKACDVEKEIKNKECDGQKKRKREVEEWLEEVRTFEEEVEELGSEVESEGLIMRLMDGGKEAKLNDEIEKLVEQSRNFGELVLDVGGNRGETLLTDELVGEAFKENLKTILRLLETREVSSIGVHGMGGVGKTTLAKHVHNQLLKQSQGRVFWVTVSQQFSIKTLQDKIARFIGVELEDEDEEVIRAARLCKALSQEKNSILILDDVWENIDMSKVGCPISVDCCRLIITTRTLEVCRRIRCQKIIPVEILGEDEAWELFNETLGNVKELSPEIEKIVKSVSKLCGGLPLGIITVGGSMRGETDIHTWRNNYEELKKRVGGEDGMGGDEVYKVLKYSFDRLNRNHESQSSEFNMFQLCFLYCSLYPEDENINRVDLVGKFISEGLVDDRKSRRAQVDRGHFILNKLVNVCLLESCVNKTDEEYVKMHDLVRGMALKIGEGKYMVRAGERSLKEIPDEQEWTEGLEKVSLMMNYGISRIGDGISPNCPNLSTLLLSGNDVLESIPESFFSKMQGLCTLDLSHNTEIRMLPDSISDMKSLKALLLEGCRELEKVPYLGKLKALRELNLSGTAIKEVPQGLEELLNLKFLSVDTDVFRGELKMLPSGLLLKLGHLQHLSLPFCIQVSVEEMKNLKEIEEFGGGVKSVNDFNWFITSRLHNPCYRIAVGPTPHHTRIGFPLLFSVSAGPLGKYNYDNELALCGVNLNDENVLGQGIACLTLKGCEGLSKCFADDLSRFNNPTSLKRLRIQCCEGIEWILRSTPIEQGIGLPSHISNTLQEIELDELKDLKGLVMQKGEIGAPSVALAQPLIFSSLKSLSISNCHKMRKVGLPVSGVPNLEKLAIYDCKEMEEIFEDEGRGSVTTLPKLKQLWIDDLPRLKSVCKATLICNSIERIFIEKCPRLMKKLPVHVDDPPPPTLEYIEVEREWWESLEWEDNPNLPRLLQPFLCFRADS